MLDDGRRFALRAAKLRALVRQLAGAEFADRHEVDFGIGVALSAGGTGYALVEDIDGLARLRGPQTQGAPDLLFMHVHEPTPGKNRWHVDLSADDVDAELDRLLSLGATLSSRHTEHGKTWAVFHDPEGNTFCLGANPT